MGLTIRYSGKFREDVVLPDLIEEVVDVAKAHGWDYSIFEKKFDPEMFGKDCVDMKLYGICFSPPKCEPVCFTFRSNGRMCCIDPLSDTNNVEEDKEYLYTIFTKTQYAGFEVHKIIIRLFRHLSEKYLADFRMHDESEYWEYNDELKSNEAFTRFDGLMNQFAESLKRFSMAENESVEEYVNRIATLIKDKENKKK